MKVFNDEGSNAERPLHVGQATRGRKQCREHGWAWPQNQNGFELKHLTGEYITSAPEIDPEAASAGVLYRINMIYTADLRVRNDAILMHLLMHPDAGAPQDAPFEGQAAKRRR